MTAADGSQISGVSDASQLIEQWVDVTRGIVRTNFSSVGRRNVFAQREPRLIVGTAVYGDSQPAISCYGTSPTVGEVLGCPAALDAGERSTTTVSRGERAGRQAVLLVTTGTMSGEEDFQFTRTRFLDPASFLPFAAEELRHGAPAGPRDPGRTQSTYTSDFVSASSLPPDFFSPQALGHAE
ncbi:MAG: hypothetical protein NVS3B26_27980 [Mycobacteriales bacterium]